MAVLLFFWKWSITDFIYVLNLHVGPKLDGLTSPAIHAVGDFLSLKFSNNSNSKVGPIARSTAAS